MSADAVLCPVCATVEVPLVRVRNVAICGHCGVSLVVDDHGQATRARALDTASLNVEELRQLVSARATKRARR